MPVCAETEKLFEPPNRTLHDCNHVAHTIPQSIGIATGGRNLVNCYINRQVRICFYVHSWTIPGQSKPGDFVFVFQKDPAIDVKGKYANAIREPETGSCIRSPRPHYVKFPMSVDPRPVMKDFQGSMGIGNEFVGVECFRSVVRLYHFDSSLQLVGEWSDISSGVLKLTWRATNREGEVALIGGRVLAGLKDSRVVNTTIKSGPKLIQQLSEIERELSRKAVVVVPDLERTCPVFLHLQGSTIGFIIDEARPILGKGFATGLCSFDALPTSLEWLHGSWIKG